MSITVSAGQSTTIGAPEWIAIIANILTVLSLFFVVRQLILQSKANTLTALENSYSRFLEVDRLCIDFPELQKFSVKSDIYEKIVSLNEAELRERAYIEYVLDMHELMFMRHSAKLHDHRPGYINALASNRHVQKYWKGSRGNFREEFEKAMDDALGSLPDTAPPQ